MILQSTELSTSQKAVLEELIGRRLSDEEAVSLRTVPAENRSPEERQAAAEKLRAFLKNLPEPKAAEDDLDAAILEAMRSVRPGYTEIR